VNKDILTSNQPIQLGRNWFQERIASHIIGDRLPRGKAFNLHRKMESQHKSHTTGTALISKLSSLLSQ